MITFDSQVRTGQGRTGHPRGQPAALPRAQVDSPQDDPDDPPRAAGAGSEGDVPGGGSERKSERSETPPIGCGSKTCAKIAPLANGTKD